MKVRSLIKGELPTWSPHIPIETEWQEPRAIEHKGTWMNLSNHKVMNPVMERHS